MTDNEFLLFDRITKIQSVIGQYGEENFMISYSGGKDSVVLSHLIDEALPENQIPRVYANTGIELNKIVEFVERERERDPRIQIIKPSTPIKPMLEKEGYPFKNKHHSDALYRYQHHIGEFYVKVYLKQIPSSTGKYLSSENACPKCLLYQFTEDFKIPISDKCCDRLKKDPLHKWQREHKKPYSIVGVMRAEGGRRFMSQCLVFRQNKLKNFQPLVPLTKEWEDWYIKERNIQLCELYYPPYNFQRTGCKGCPFTLQLQQDLDVLDRFFPLERKQCEIIWKPVYNEYRRIGYRLRPADEGRQMSIEEFLQEDTE